jgi:hypothetical protein
MPRRTATLTICSIGFPLIPANAFQTRADEPTIIPRPVEIESNPASVLWHSLPECLRKPFYETTISSSERLGT